MSRRRHPKHDTSIVPVKDATTNDITGWNLTCVDLQDTPSQVRRLGDEKHDHRDQLSDSGKEPLDLLAPDVNGGVVLQRKLSNDEKIDHHKQKI